MCAQRSRGEKLRPRNSDSRLFSFVVSVQSTQVLQNLIGAVWMLCCLTARVVTAFVLQLALT